MTLRMNGNLEIENLNHYPAELVEDLRRTLARGAEATPDPKRKRLFELESERARFYIDILPSGHRVILLAAWPVRSARS